MKKITFLIFMSFMSFLGYAQFPENFDAGIPATWNVMDNGVGTVQSWTTTSTLFLPTHGGTQHALIDRGNIGVGNTSEDWLVTPLTTVPTNGQLRFWSKMTLAGDFGTLYQIRVSTTSQTNQASFTTFQQWTEPEFETAIATGGSNGYNVYGEIVLPLSTYAGQNVYIAFVKVHTQTGSTANPYYGDRWLLDDVNVVQQCNDPVTLNATQISATTAQLSWTSPGPASSWDIEMVLSSGSPSGFPTASGVTNPYVYTGLTPGTQYKYYVRSVCSTGATSNWVGPFIFNTTPFGQTCAGPIVTTPLPYTHTSNTASYGDVVDGSPGASCGITGNYLNGNDVFYSFTPTFTGVVDISMTPTGNNSGVFVYGSCADIGSVCMAGVANTAGGIRNIPFFSVTAGVTYYIVISTSGTPQTIPYTLTIQQVGCPPPNNLGASGISQTGATLTWGNPAAASAWQYVFQPAGGGLPTGAGTPVATTSAAITGLTANTNYEFYVRVDCGAGTFSAWAGPFTFRTLCTALPVPFTEGFNSTSTTQACWTVLNANADANAWNMDYATNPFEGNQSASIVSSSVANNDWLISPQITLNGNQRLKYRYRVETVGSPCTFEVRLSTNGPSPADLTTVLVTPTSYNNTTYIEKVVNMVGVTGNVNIGWYVAPGTNGSRIYIDQVIVEDIPACAEPNNLAVSNIASTSATISWIPGNTETSWQVLVQPTGLPAPTLPTQGVTVTGTPTYNATPLNGSTTYDVYVMADCGVSGPSVWVGPITFRTPQLPGTLPFSDTFEGNFDWDVVNGTQVNKWFAGTAVNNGGTRSMYISNNSGAANAYTITSTSVVQAFRDIAIPAGTNQVNVAFDWRAMGELIGTTYYDYFRVWAVPTTFVPTAGTQITAAADRINLSGNINQGAAWARRNLVLNATQFAGQTMRLVFEWRNDGTGGTQPPAAIDNINVTIITCPAPTAVNFVSSTTTTATLQWTAGASETAWEIVVQPIGAGQPTGASTIIPAGTNPFTVNGLTPMTGYEYYVRAVCGASDLSTWSGPRTFFTACSIINVPFQEGFNSTSPTQQCWTVVNGNNDADAWNMDYATNPFEGNQSAVMYTDFNAGNNNDWLISPTLNLSATPGPKRLKFHYRVNSATEPNDFRVVLSTTGTATANFTETIIPLASYNNITYVQKIVNLVDTSGNPYTGNVNIAWHVPNGGLDGWYLYIDNVIVEDIPPCPDPSNLLVSNVTNNSAVASWTAGYNETQWEIVVQPAGTGAPTGASIIIPVGTNPFTITGLSPSTNYEYYIRANCGANGTSTWIGPRTFTTTQIPGTLPYVEGFEGTSGFTVTNGTQVNKWTEGTAVNNGGTRSMYISNDTGTTNAYTITSTSIVHAYRDIAIPATCTQVLNFSFDWRSMGQSAADFLNVWVVPSTFIPTAGTGITAAASGGTQLSNQLINGASFATLTYSVNGAPYAGQTMRVIFEWRNNATTGTQPPAAIDNLTISLPTCPKPYNLSVVGTPTPTSANVSWTPGCTETAWEIVVLPTGSPAPTAATSGTSVTTAPPYTITGLQASTTYDFYVRAICTAGTDVSVWSGPKTFTTFIGNDECAGAYTVPVNNTDQCTLVSAGMFNGATVSTVGGTTCGAINSGDIWFQFTATNASHTIDLIDFTVYNNPIMMTLYSGNCSTLNQIACSFNNSITVSNLQVGSTYILRTSISAATTDTNVRFNVCVKVPMAPASGTSLSCLINTVNPSFEYPAITGTFPRFADLYDHMVLGWRTTAPGHQMEFWPAPNYENHTAHSGRQFIELNATEVSGVYQDFATPITTVFTYRYAHKGRQGTDTVAVLAGPPGGPYIEIDRRSTGNGPNAWSYPAARAYTVPAGQTVTRFIFQSISSVGGATIGNFLDSIEFKADNSIVSASPLSLDCTTSNSTTVVGAGAGSWSAAPGNPAATVIASPDDNTTTISGFTVSGTYTFNWTTLYCTSTVDIVYADNGNRVPQFTAVAPVCAGTTLAALPTTSTDGITGTWSPALDNTTTTTYTFTPNAGQCAIPTTMAITITPNTTPTFAAVTPICAGESLTALPTTSNEGITGTWSPALDNTTTTIYTFTPDAGQCALSSPMTITVNPIVTPTFTQVTPICAGESLAALPTTSNEGITGTWSPALDNTNTGTYTFTPDAGQCALTSPMTITVNPNVTPTFTQVAPICSGESLTALPTTSNEGITGTWSPALDNTNTATYTFTPDAGQCALTSPMTITVNPNVTPTFTQVAPICSGESLTALPTTSNEGITGTWSPALDNTNTATYTFTPDAGQCALTSPMTITVTPNVTPTFTQVTPICAGESLTALPTTSNEGITGTWSPALDNTNTTTYTFTPDAGQCAISSPMTITVNPNVTPTFTQVAPICAGESLTALPTTSNEGITGTWSPALDNTNTTTYTFTPDAGQCALSSPMTITVNQIVTPTFTQVAPICAGESLAALPTTSNEGITGTWSPALDNANTTTYTFTPDAGQCAISSPMTITVNPSTTSTFTQVAPICAGELLAALPTTSNEGITGTWSPALDNTTTTTYTFTPDAGQCALPAAMTITVTSITPTFTQVAPICAGELLAALPITSNEGITGTWSPALDNTNTTTYTFTPDAGQCALSTPMTITVNPGTTPTFTAVEPICPGDSITLPTTSNEGITGTWSPALDNTTTTTYTFTPSAGQCASEGTIIIEVSDDCMIPNGISPNGDGKNDTFDLTNMNIRKLSIFNRYGVTAYTHGSGYTNQWHGQSDAGQELPDGTYYYVIDTVDGQTKTGWVYINRER
jgi:gliding motility-associated-like protein